MNGLAGECWYPLCDRPKRIASINNIGQKLTFSPYVIHICTHTDLLIRYQCFLFCEFHQLVKSQWPFLCPLVKIRQISSNKFIIFLTLESRASYGCKVWKLSKGGSYLIPSRLHLLLLSSMLTTSHTHMHLRCHPLSSFATSYILL